MAAAMRSHSRLTNIPGTEIHFEAAQLVDQILELVEPSEDVHRARVEEITRKLRDAAGDLENHSTRVNEAASYTKEWLELEQRYAQDQEAYAERRRDLENRFYEIQQQWVNTTSAPLGTRRNLSDPEPLAGVDGAATANADANAILSPNIPPPPTVPSSSTNAAASQTQPPRQPTTAISRAPKRKRPADESAQHQQDPSHSHVPHRSQTPRNSDRHIDFHKVFDNGNATHKYIIHNRQHTIPSQGDDISGQFWILRDDGCNLHFSAEKGEAATMQSALKHIRNNNFHRGQACNEANVMRCFGVVVNCTAEQYRQNNEAVIAAIRNGQYDPETQLKKQKRLREEVPGARRSARRTNQPAEITVSGEPTPTIIVPDTTPSPPGHHPTEVPTWNIADHQEPGGIHIIYWNGGPSRRRAKAPYAGVLLPMGDFESIGLRGNFDDTPLATDLPSCYYRTATTTDWKEAYKDGGPKVDRRKYPFLCVDKTTSIDDCSLDWIQASDIKQFDEHAFHYRYRRVLVEYQKRTAEQGRSGSDISASRAIADRRPSPFEDETTRDPKEQGISRAGRERTFIDENAVVTNQPEATPSGPQPQQPSDFGGTVPRPPAVPTSGIEVDQDHLYDIETINFRQEFLADAESIPPQSNDAPQTVPAARMHSHTPSLHRVDDAPQATSSLTVEPLTESTRRLNTASTTISWSQDKDAGRTGLHHAQQGPPLSPWSLSEQMMRSGNVSPISEALL